MKLLQTLKTVIEYRKKFKTLKVVSFDDAKAYEMLSFACCYRAQESVARFYCSFYTDVSFNEAMELIHYSKALRNVLTDVIRKRLINAEPKEFDFTLNKDSVQFFREFQDKDHYLTIAKLYPQEYGVGLMQMLSLKTEQAYYLYLRKEKGYKKEWKAFTNDLLHEEGFSEPAYIAMKSWIANLVFPREVWLDKGVLNLMNEGKERIATFGRQG